ncbi:MAG: hypothetical protein JWN03_6434 [Nocardia sp.]|uniref:SHOCT domain-containing protein n=1 Tax=Nocardia sp. TaxID=1821 RepID=UPI00261A10AB|nr:SHOCT domain-containing protein [Nocardia sp.]MCU1646159.1 hypothetical protein [Nocardia sp.]
MTVGKLAVVFWAWFIVMCVGFMPALLAVNRISGLAHPVRVGLSVFVVAVLWWGPFVYGMYLVQVGMGGGDKRLFKRGIRGTGVILSAKATNTMIGGGSDMGRMGRTVYLYGVRVSLPKQQPYETFCRIAAYGLRAGQTVDIYAAPHNRKRIAIDRGQRGGTIGYVPGAVPRTVKYDAPRVDWSAQATRADAARIQQLTELARLHRDGSLTDAEFAAEKARLLGS